VQTGKAVSFPAGLSIIFKQKDEHSFINTTLIFYYPAPESNATFYQSVKFPDAIRAFKTNVNSSNVPDRFLLH
jgi:hypothetical protein